MEQPAKNTPADTVKRPAFKLALDKINENTPPSNQPVQQE